jgi:subtilisin family serine protease
MEETMMNASLRNRKARVAAAFAIVLTGFLFAAGTSARAMTPGGESMRVPLAAGAEKVDPWLRLALSTPGGSVARLMPVARNIEIAGSSLDDLSYPVLFRTTLNDAELAARGVVLDTRAGDIVTSTLTPGQLRTLAADPAVSLIEASRWLAATLDVSVPESRADLVNNVGDPPAGYTGRGVIVGLIDSGIDHTHEDFQKPDGTSRILYIWDHQRDGSPPAGYSYGYEYTKAMIDAGQANQHVDQVAHGTHCAGIAAGDGSSLANHPYRGVAWEADIIAVRNGGSCDVFCYGGGVPPWDTGGYLYGQNGGTKGSIDGLNYMIAKAKALGKPLVVNQSQGVGKGPHDGTTLFEQAYNQLVTDPQKNLIICIAAGNEQQMASHGQAIVPAGGSASFTISKTWSSAEGDVTNFFMDFECWYPAGKQFRWEVQAPGGDIIEVPASVPASQYPYQWTARPDSAAYWTTTQHPANNQGYANFVIYNWRSGIETGTWTVRAIDEEGSGGTVDLYVERNQYTARVVQGLSLDNIVSMPGTADQVITVASYNSKLSWTDNDGQTWQALNENPVGDISSFSGWGPRRDGAAKPDLAAPGAWIMSVLASGSQPDPRNVGPGGKHKIISGTSMAAPHVTGAVALMLQKKPDLLASEVKSILRQTARQDGFTGQVPNAKWGSGKLDVKAAVDAVGGGGSCATTPGDANQDHLVNILDVVVTVNDILQVTPLGEPGRACADVDGSNSVDILDVVTIVNRILHPGAPAPLALAGPGAAPVAWGREVTREALRFRIDGSRVGGLEISVILARGWRLGSDAPANGVVAAGAASTSAATAEAAASEAATAGSGMAVTGVRIDGAAFGVSVLAHEGDGVCRLVAYAPSGGALGSGPVTLEIPLAQVFDGGVGPEALEIAQIVVADPGGRPLVLAPMPSLGAADEDARSLLPATAVPNPSSGLSHVRYQLLEDGPVTVAVYDAAGRSLRALWNGMQTGGGHELVWDGRDDEGVRVPAGAYFVRVRTASAEVSRKLLVVR